MLGRPAEIQGPATAIETPRGQHRLALPDIVPLAASPADWRTPASLAALITPGRPAPLTSSCEPAPAVPDGPGRHVAHFTTAEDGDAS
jgi:putative transposase